MYFGEIALRNSVKQNPKSKYNVKVKVRKTTKQKNFRGLNFM